MDKLQEQITENGIPYNLHGEYYLLNSKADNGPYCVDGNKRGTIRLCKKENHPVNIIYHQGKIMVTRWASFCLLLKPLHRHSVSNDLATSIIGMQIVKRIFSNMTG